MALTQSVHDAELGADQPLSPVLPPSARARTCTTVPVVRPIRRTVRDCAENLTLVHTPALSICTSKPIALVIGVRCTASCVEMSLSMR